MVKKISLLLSVILPLLVCFTFPFYLMFHTLSYDTSTSSLLVGGKYWSDFGSHLPLIRSFSLGLNWPPEHPLFPGEPIKYHYAFYSTVGFLEHLGLRLDLALNLPSALGLSALLLLVWLISLRLTRSHLFAALVLLLVLFNASFSWLDYLRAANFSLSTALTGLSTLREFPAFRPWNSSLITAFWSWNVYSNQRHLGLSFAIVLLIIYTLLFRSRRLSIFTGFLLGSLLLTNQAALLIAGVSLLVLWPFASGIRLRVLFSSLGVLPWLVGYFTTLSRPVLPQLELGFLAPQPLTLPGLLQFWFANFGPTLVLAPAGVIFAPRRLRPLILVWLALFLLGNFFRLSPDLINNHKLFNFALIIGAFFSAAFLFRLRYFALFLLPLCLAGGFIDLFPVIHDKPYTLSDYPSNPDVKFFLSHTPPDAVVVNSTWFYHPASLAGRPIYNGYSYFTWSYGYDQVTRETATQQLYAAPDLPTLCNLLSVTPISYLEFNPAHEEFIHPSSLWSTLSDPVYVNPSSGFKVYSRDRLCPPAL